MAVGTNPSFRAGGLALALLLAGCVGSPVAYHPYRDERPKPESDEAREQAKFIPKPIPMEVERQDAYFVQGEKEIARILGTIPRNPWMQYEREMVRVLEDEARPHLGARYEPAHRSVFGEAEADRD